jgi:hypothetical protein
VLAVEPTTEYFADSTAICGEAHSREAVHTAPSVGP